MQKIYTCKKYIFRVLFVLSIGLCAPQLFAQIDFPLSMQNDVSMMINPAKTGTSQNGQASAFYVNYKSQYNNFFNSLGDMIGVGKHHIQVV